MGDMHMPQRTPEHDKLNFMVGEWKTQEVHAKSPMNPAGGTGEGRTSYRWTVGKLVLHNEYKSKGPMGPAFEGLGLIMWDPAKKVYVHAWHDSMMPTGVNSYGRFEGTDLIVKGDMPSPMGTMKMVMVTHPVSANEFLFTMSMEHEGKLVPMVTITHVKA